jgi:ComF family protein
MLNRRGVDRGLRRVGLLAREMVGLLIPPLCVACERRLATEERWLCRDCSIALGCEAKPMTRLVDDDSGRALEVRYCLGYTSRVARIIAEMKYGDKPGLARLLVPFIGFAVGELMPAGTAAVPVPVHASKRRERGYNQSRILAEGLAKMKGFRVRDVLKKRRMTVSQTTLERDRRLSNLVGCFTLRSPMGSPPERALLVDDVVTTGATLRECAWALRAAGTKEVTACAVAASP